MFNKLYPDVNQDQSNAAMQLALLAGGAGMMNPSGAYGEFGTQFSRGIQQAVGTYAPLMQFGQRQAQASKELKRRQEMFDQQQGNWRQNFREGQRRDRRNFEFDQKKFEADQEYRNKMLGLQFQKARADAAAEVEEWMPKSSDTNTMSKLVLQVFGDDYHPVTGDFIIKDDQKKKLAQAVLAEAELIRRRDPKKIDPSAAVSRALEKYGINLPSPSVPNPQNPHQQKQVDPQNIRGYLGLK